MVTDLNHDLQDINKFNFWMASTHPLITRIFKAVLGKNATSFAFNEQQHIDTIAKYGLDISTTSCAYMSVLISDNGRKRVRRC